MHVPLAFLADEAAFIEWVSAKASPRVNLSSHSNMQHCFDSVALFHLLTSLETEIEQEFPTELIDSMETLGDWFYYAQTKASHG